MGWRRKPWCWHRIWVLTSHSDQTFRFRICEFQTWLKVWCNVLMIFLFQNPSQPLLEGQTTTAPLTTPAASMTPQSQTINPPQPIPFIPMVPPLANTFSSTMVPTVTSALVDNLINNNPTPTTLSFGAPTTVTSSSVPQNISQQFVTQDSKASENIANANTTGIDNLTGNTANLFISSNPSDQLIQNEQNTVIQPPSSIPAFYQQASAPPPASTFVNQHFVQSEGKQTLMVKICEKLIIMLLFLFQWHRRFRLTTSRCTTRINSITQCNNQFRFHHIIQLMLSKNLNKHSRQLHRVTSSFQIRIATKLIHSLLQLVHSSTCPRCHKFKRSKPILKFKLR